MAFHKNLRGGDLHAPSNEIVENNTGSTLTQLTVVRLDGNGTVFPQVQAAHPSVSPNFGVVAGDIPTGKVGYVACLGFVVDVDTHLWVEASQLYSDNSGALTLAPNGSPVAIVLKQDAAHGILYVYAVANSGGSGPITGNAWEITGNVDVDPDIYFLGTSDSTPLPIRTNNNKIAIFDVNGRFGLGTQTPERHFELKSHTSVNASGLQQETFYVETSDATPQIVYSITLEDPSVYKVEITITGRAADGTARASYKRSGLWYRESSNVQVEGAWQSDFTMESMAGFGVSYVTTTTDLVFRIKAPTSDLYRWTGSVSLQRIN